MFVHSGLGAEVALEPDRRRRARDQLGDALTGGPIGHDHCRHTGVHSAASSTLTANAEASFAGGWISGSPTPPKFRYVPVCEVGGHGQRHDVYGTRRALVVVTGAITLGLVAAAVGPPIFHDHLRQVAGQVSAEANRHVEEAYASASAVSLGVALAALLAAALAVSAYVARQVARPVAALAAAAADVADGRYDVRVTAAGLGTEFDTLAGAFNAMAARLHSVETTRRRLLADLGHEMRTPLTTIEAYLDAAEDGVGVDDEDTLSVLRTQTARLRRLAEDIAAVSRAEEHQLDLHPVRTAPADLARAAGTRPPPDRSP